MLSTEDLSCLFVVNKWPHPLNLTFRLENQCVLTKYQAIWDRYKEQYERRENAKELERIKTSAKQENEQCKSTNFPFSSVHYSPLYELIVGEIVRIRVNPTIHLASW